MLLLARSILPLVAVSSYGVLKNSSYCSMAGTGGICLRAIEAFTSIGPIGGYGGLLVPGKPLAVETFLEQGSLDGETVDPIERGQLQLNAYGRITSESAGLARVNQFCYAWHPLTGVTFEGDEAGFHKLRPR